ncbi:hypothetical protein Tco_0669075 [Tanacetum coccineum]
MPWRHGDTDLHDDLLANYNENDVARFFEFLVPLQPPPRHLLYVCGLTTAFRHPELRYDIKDQDNNVINMDTFLKLPNWIGTVVSKGDPIPEDQRPKPRVTPPMPVGSKLPELTAFQKSLEKPNLKIAAAREKKEQQNLAKVEAKRAGAGRAEGPRKKQWVQKQNEPTQSGSEETLSATPLRQAIPEVAKKPATVIAPEVANDGPHVEKEVVDLSGNTHVSTPPAVANQPSPPFEHHDVHENIDLDAHSQQSSHQGHGDELVSNRYVPNWGFATIFASVLIVLVEDEFFESLSNAEVISHAYQTLGQSVVAQGELLKRHEQLNHNYVDLRNRNDAQLVELDHLRSCLRRANQDNEGMTQKLTLLENA